MSESARVKDDRRAWRAPLTRSIGGENLPRRAVMRLSCVPAALMSRWRDRVATTSALGTHASGEV